MLVGVFGVEFESLGREVRVQDRRVISERRPDIHDDGQRIVLYIDQLQRRRSDVRVNGRNRGHRLADPEHLLARHVDERDVPEVMAGFAEGKGRSERYVDEVRSSDGREHALQCQRTRHVDADDAGMRLRAALDAPIDHAGSCEVGGVDGAAGYALAGVHAGEALADDFLVLGSRCGDGHVAAACDGLAIERMASTILS